MSELPKPDNHLVSDLERLLLGQTARIEHPDEGRPTIHFDSDFKIVVGAFWRLIDCDRILVTDSDDGQWFGLPAPVDAARKANERLEFETLDAVEFSTVTGDLKFRFSGQLTLEILTNSSGYESWVMFHRDEHFAVGASGGLV